MKQPVPARRGFLAAASFAAAFVPLAPAVEAASLTVDIPALTCTTPVVTTTSTGISIGCAVVNPPPPPPSGNGPSNCFVAADNMFLPATGGKVTLGAACLAGNPTSYTWTRNGAPFGTPASGSVLGNDQSDTLPANTLATPVTYNYVVYASNANGASPTFSLIVTVAGVPGGGTGGGGGGGGVGGTGAITCSGFTKTLTVDGPWTASPPRQITQTFGGFGWNDALVVRFTVPAGVTSTSTGYFALAEWGGGSVYRYATISDTPCDFAKPYPYAWQGITVQAEFTVGVGAGAVLQPGKTYYLNVRSTYPNGQASCPSGSACDMFIDFVKPAGT